MNGQNDPALPLTSITIVLAILGVLIVQQIPLTPSRPSVPGDSGHEKIVSPHDVPARLWQDPLAAARKFYQNAKSQALTSQILESVSQKVASEAVPGKKQDGAKDNQNTSDKCQGFSVEVHTSCDLWKQINGRVELKKHVIILGVMIPGGPYAEDVEGRLRSRYAVLSALDVSGFAPTNSTHIGYFEPQSNNNDSAINLPSVVPYEWLQPKANESATDPQNTQREENKNHTPKTEVLVLWLDDNVLNDSKDPSNSKPLAGIGALFHPLISKQPTEDKGTIRVKILGPASSGTLRAMIEEVKKEGEVDSYLKYIKEFQFYSPFATADDC